MQRDDIVARAERVPGYMTPREIAWLSEQASQLPEGGVWVELGVMVGRSLLAVGLSLPPNAVLIAVDSHLLQQEFQEHTLAGTLAELLKLRPDVEVRLMRQDTLMAASAIPAGVDVAFIDSSHERQATMDEIHVYRQQLRPGGLLCGHDYNIGKWPGVTEAVQMMLPHSHTVAVGTSIWWHRKAESPEPRV